MFSFNLYIYIWTCLVLLVMINIYYNLIENKRSFNYK
uniref:Uncharacterized protein n=1 Tax=viral metagenome TaxID=1070528 RepID=A0A6C0H8W7_9ZZZZ